jgi:hypothetical protein
LFCDCCFYHLFYGALMSSYAGTPQLINYMFGTLTTGTIGAIGGTLTPSVLQLMQDSLDEAERVINDYTRRNFAGTGGTYYVNRYSQRLVRNQALYLQTDLHTLVGLVNGDNTVFPIGSVWLEPRNAGPPYRLLRLHSPYVYVWNTDSDIVVSGTFGFSTVAPAAIARACVELAAYYYRVKDIAPTDTAGVNAAGELMYPKNMPDYVRSKLEPYRSRSGGVV